MFIRRTTIKSRESGERYYTYRLVESVRTAHSVRQHTVLNLGRHFAVPRAQWGALVQRIEAVLGGQLDLLADGLDPAWEALAEEYAARIVRRRGASPPPGEEAPASDYQRVDLDRVELLRPRSVGAEYVALQALRQLALDAKLLQLGFNRHQLSAAIGVIVGRMVHPASERATHRWLAQRSALGELLDYDFADLDLNQLYRVGDRLLVHREALQAHLYGQECDLFSLNETITLYDLTNTFFEGTAKTNAKAKRGHSKEKRSGCPLVTLALVLDGSGFPKRSEIFAGNVSEAETLEQMVKHLSATAAARPTVVMDAGIATAQNVAWLKAQGYPYLVVSRERNKQFDPEPATVIRDQPGVRIRVQRVLDEDTGEVRLYCHSSAREDKERGIAERFCTRLEAELTSLAEGLPGQGLREGPGAHRTAAPALCPRRPLLRHPVGERRDYWPHHRPALAAPGSHRGPPPRRLLPAHRPHGVERVHPVADLHHAHRPRGGVPLAEIGAGSASGLPPPEQADRRPPLPLRAGLPPGPHPAPATQGPGD